MDWRSVLYALYELPNLSQSLQQTHKQQMHKRNGDKLIEGEDEYDGLGGHWQQDR